ncbi:hypothetical protein ACFVHQ_01755 [Actinomycetes bacterium NPDC127524]
MNADLARIKLELARIIGDLARINRESQPIIHLIGNKTLRKPYKKYFFSAANLSYAKKAHILSKMKLNSTE